MTTRGRRRQPWLGDLLNEMELVTGGWPQYESLPEELSHDLQSEPCSSKKEGQQSSHLCHVEPSTDSTCTAASSDHFPPLTKPKVATSSEMNLHQNSNMNVVTAQPSSVANRISPAPVDGGLRISPMVIPVEGLESMDRETLIRSIQPIRKALEGLDAEAMLGLQRTGTGGARLKGSIRCKPIHNEVTPPKRQSGSVVRYVHLQESPDKYSIGIFIFPPNAKIPLHDHPGMCVLSRVLYGDLTRLSLDLLHDDEEMDLNMGLEPPDEMDTEPGYDSEKSKSWFSMFPSFRSSTSSISDIPTREDFPEGSRRAFLNEVDHLEAPNVAVLYPYEGNLHEFVAGPDGAAVLDVLLPPYDEGHERECTFYNIREDGNCTNKSSHRPCWIIPTGQPEDFHCLSGRYRDLGGGDEE